MAITVSNITVDALPGMVRQYGEGLIIQDCDMNPHEAANVVNQTFAHGVSCWRGASSRRSWFSRMMAGPICCFLSSRLNWKWGNSSYGSFSPIRPVTAYF